MLYTTRTLPICCLLQVRAPLEGPPPEAESLPASLCCCLATSSSCCPPLLQRARVPRRGAPSTTRTRTRRGALSRCMRQPSRGWARRSHGGLLVATCCMGVEQGQGACAGGLLVPLHGAEQVETAHTSPFFHSPLPTPRPPLTTPAAGQICCLGAEKVDTAPISSSPHSPLPTQ